MFAVMFKEARSMGISDPDVRKKLTEARYLQYRHLSETQKWHWWRRLFHRLQPCPICRPEKAKGQHSQ
jgi:hypothetical protein